MKPESRGRFNYSAVTLIVLVLVVSATGLFSPQELQAYSGVYQGAWCHHDGSCYEEGSSSSSSSGCPGCIPRIFCLFGACEEPEQEQTSESEQRTSVYQSTEADIFSMKYRAKRIQTLQRNLRRPVQAHMRGQVTSVTVSGATPIFGQHNRSFAGFTPTSYTPGTNSAIKALRRSVAILTLAKNPGTSSYDQAFFGQQAAAALAGQAVRVDMLEPDEVINMSRRTAKKMEDDFLNHVKKSQSVEKARSNRRQLETKLRKEMDAIVKNLPRACYAGGNCKTSEAMDRKNRLDQIYVKYRRALREEASSFQAQERSAKKLETSIQKKVTVLIEGAPNSP